MQFCLCDQGNIHIFLKVKITDKPKRNIKNNHNPIIQRLSLVTHSPPFSFE